MFNRIGQYDAEYANNDGYHSTGTGIAGNTVSTTINGKSYTATIGSDGKYEIKLNDGLGHFSHSNADGRADYGESESVTKDVTIPPLTIKNSTQR